MCRETHTETRSVRSITDEAVSRFLIKARVVPSCILATGLSFCLEQRNVKGSKFSRVRVCVSMLYLTIAVQIIP